MSASALGDLMEAAARVTRSDALQHYPQLWGPLDAAIKAAARYQLGILAEATPTKPPHMSDQQWMDTQAMETARRRAHQLTHGMVKVSDRRYLVITANGAIGTTERGEYWSYMDYDLVKAWEPVRPNGLSHDEARGLLRKLWTGEVKP